MYKILFSIVLLLAIYLSIAEDKYKCDYVFGDQSWNSSKEFYNHVHVIPSGSKNWNITLPNRRGKLISFICVNAVDEDKKISNMTYSAAFFRLRVFLSDFIEKKIPLHVIALEDSY